MIIPQVDAPPQYDLYDAMVYVMSSSTSDEFVWGICYLFKQDRNHVEAHIWNLNQHTTSTLNTYTNSSNNTKTITTSTATSTTHPKEEEVPNADADALSRVE